MNKIDDFSNEYSFLSNFYFCKVEFDGEVYPSVEHAFQAAKTFNAKERELIRKEPTPGKAKKLGKNVLLRSDWEEVKVSIMYDLVYQKFQNEDLKQKILNTNNKELIEGNHWGDRFWGVCSGIGENNLGKILMKIRQQLRSNQDG